MPDKRKTYTPWEEFIRDAFNTHPSFTIPGYAPEGGPEVESPEYGYSACGCPECNDVLATIESSGSDTVIITNRDGVRLEIPDNIWADAVDLMEARYNELVDLRENFADGMAEDLLGSAFGGRIFAPPGGFVQVEELGTPDYIYVSYSGEVTRHSLKKGRLEESHFTPSDALEFISGEYWIEKAIKFHTISDPYLVDA